MKVPIHMNESRFRESSHHYIMPRAAAAADAMVRLFFLTAAAPSPVGRLGGGGGDGAAKVDFLVRLLNYSHHLISFPRSLHSEQHLLLPQWKEGSEVRLFVRPTRGRATTDRVCWRPPACSLKGLLPRSSRN